MKIIFLTRRFWPDQGGVEKHVYEISKILIKKGHSVIVVTESQGEEDLLDGIKIERIPKSQEGWTRKFYIWKWIILNWKMFQKSNIVHAHDVYYQYLPIKLLFLNKKSFVTFHGYETYPISNKAVIIRKFSEVLATGSIAVGDFIKKWYGTTPNYIIYGGVEISNIKYQISNKPKRESAVFIGRLDEHTGVLDYAKAVDLIRKKYPKFDFKIIGDGIYKKRLERYRSLGFKENSMEYLAQSNFAFVSRYLSILEALISKRLVFALYDNPVKEDYLRMAPFSKFIIISNNPVDLSRKVNYFLENPKQARKFITKGYEWAINQTWENVANVYLKLWKRK